MEEGQDGFDRVKTDPDASGRTAGATARFSSAGPPVDWGELLQSFGDGAFEQPSPDDLPMIDIHHR